MKNYIVEFIGTFFLVSVIGLSGGNALAIAAILMVMVYMGAHISGAHYNPAVTLAILIRKKIGGKDAAMYMIFQVLGALAAALCFYLSFGKAMGAPTFVKDINVVKPIFFEAAFTFALALVVLNVATHPKTANNSFYGLAIGFTVFAGASSVGPVTGGAFNPAVGLGPHIIGAVDGRSMADLWLYLVGPFLGGGLAGLLYNWLNFGETN